MFLACLCLIMLATSKDRKINKFELQLAEFIINVRIGKETESSNILVDQELPRPSFSLLHVLTGIISCT